MKKIFQSLLLVCAVALANHSQAQGNVVIGGQTADASALLDLQSTEKGLLIPRLTTVQRMAMPQKAAGLLVYDIDKRTIMLYDGKQWLALQQGDVNQTAGYALQPDSIIRDLHYGAAVDRTANWAAVGAYGHFGPGDNSSFLQNASMYGAVYMYEKVNGAWVFRQLLQPSDRASGDRFGYAVALQDSFLLAGAPYADPSGKKDAGKVYLYKLVNGQWIEQQTIVASDGEENDRFGLAIAADSLQCIVGAPFKRYTNGNTNRNNAGAFYIGRINAITSGWTEDYHETVNGSNAETRFGWSVDLDGNHAIIGSPFSEFIVDGSVIIKQRTGVSNWSTTVLSQMGTNKGQSVSIDSNIAVGLGTDGTIYTWQLKNGIWGNADVMQQSTSLLGNSSLFGKNISLSLPYVLVGYPGKDIGDYVSQGKAVLFQLGKVLTELGEITIWERVKDIVSKSEKSYEGFGDALQIKNGQIIIGSRAIPQAIPFRNQGMILIQEWE